MNKLHRLIIFSLTIFFISSHSLASSKFSFSAGGFSVSGKGGSKAVSVSGLGAYRLGLQQELRNSIYLSLGYNIIYDSVFTGDSIYGLDIGGSWFFLEPALVEVFQSEDVTLKITRQWSPYVGIHFNQRQFQSNKANYSGLGFHGGSQFPIKDNFSWHGEVRYNSLSGPGQATASEMSLLVGVSSEFL
jgi:hypothetical protein